MKRLLDKLKNAQAQVVGNVEGFHVYHGASPCDMRNAAREHGLQHTYNEDADPNDSDHDPEVWSDGVKRGLSYETADCSGIVPLSTALRAISDMGGHFDGTNTMGTLGGPLGYWVPDLSFEVESSHSAWCIRLTPYVQGKHRPLDRCGALSELLKHPKVNGDPYTAARLIEEHRSVGVEGVVCGV